MKPTAKIIQRMAAVAVALVAAVIVAGPLAPAALAETVQPRLALDDPAGGPFPSDLFTAPDATQLTGLRVDLPKPVCDEHPSDCDDIDVLNQLDGFNLQPRLSIPFTGPIDLKTVSSETVFLCKLTECPAGSFVGINQLVWDPGKDVLYAESDQFLDQHTRYLLVVTNGVRDPAGDRIDGGQFRRVLRSQIEGDAETAYRQQLLAAVDSLSGAGIPPGQVAAASLFTTESATAVMEKIRDQVKAATPAPAEFRLGSSGERTVFPFADVASIVFRPQVNAAPPLQPPVQVPVGADGLNVVPGAIGTVAFGKYSSPGYETPAGVIPAVGTRTGVPAVQRTTEVYFNLFLPSGPEPPGGWPVVIAGHGGGGGGKNTGNVPVAIASKLAQHGMATIAISAAGYGGGPLSTLTVTKTDGSTATLLAGGRNIDRNGNGMFEQPPGGQIPEGVHTRPDGRQAIVFMRDDLRQTVVDLMQLVREIEAGIDVDGDAAPDLDSSSVHYLGNSLGGMYGAGFAALEPALRASVLGVAGGPMVNVGRLNAAGPYRGLIGQLLAVRQPSLVNGGPDPINPANPFPFRESLPLRNEETVVNNVPGAIAIQEAIERIECVPVRPVLFTVSLGEPVNSNVNTTALLRAGDLADRTTMFRGIEAYKAMNNPPPGATDLHEFLVRLTALGKPFALAAQDAVATFLTSDGEVTVNPDGGLGQWFETPIAGPLPGEH